MSRIVFFQERYFPGFYVKFNYDQGFIEALKASVPSSGREWHPDKKVWWVDDPYFGTILRMSYRWFDEVVDKTQPTSSAPGAALATPHSVLFLLPNAPAPVIKAAYRALSKMYHPDTGGDPEKMKLVNLAYEAIEEAHR